MTSATERSYSRRDTVLFAVCVALSLVGLLSPPQWGLGIADRLRETVLLPLVWLQNRAEEGKTSRERFRVVTAERDSAAYLSQGLPSLRAENDRLRQLLALGPPDPHALRRRGGPPPTADRPTAARSC